MKILSIQSRVTSGYVGNAAAVPILQRLGCTVWPVDTVTFSNHPAHGAHTGGIRPAPEIEMLIRGLCNQNLHAQCDAILTGYLGSANIAPIIIAAVQRIRDANPAALWCCDPVMGDHGQFYVTEDIPQFFRNKALPNSNIILPNAFEAEHLSGISVTTVSEAAKAASLLLAKGPKTVIITGIIEGDQVGAVAADANGCWACLASAIAAPTYGAGDAFTSLFVCHYLKSNDLRKALGRAVNGIHKILSRTAKARTADLDLIAALPALDELAPLPVKKIGWF